MKCIGERHARQYRMRKRADAAADTARRIIDATIQLHTERFHDEITLDEIATRAGVTVQTVLRRFHSKDRLIEAAADDSRARVVEQRGQATPGDIPGAVDVLLTHYEEWGPAGLRLLAQEDRVPQLRGITDRAREVHVDWVRRVFAPFLDGRPARRRLEAELIALTDVYVWKVLRVDRQLDRADTATALTHMITGVLRTEGEA